MAKKKHYPLLFIGVLLAGLAIQYYLGFYLLEDYIFDDSTADSLETAMYMGLALPPFIIAMLFYLETKSVLKSIGYSVFFYLVSAIVISLFDYVPGHRELGASAFYVTGGGVTPFGITLVPLFVVTGIIVYGLSLVKKKYFKK